MMRQIIFIILFLILSLQKIPLEASTNEFNVGSYEMIVATDEELVFAHARRTVDPACAVETESMNLIYNIYEPLLTFNRESIDEFVPLLATNWTISSDALRITFKIRQGVKFHNGELLTTDDVEYSFERAMVYGRSWPICMSLNEALLNIKYWGLERLFNLSDPLEASHLASMIDNSIQRNETHVWFNLAKPFNFNVFLQILSVCPVIVNKRFCIQHGDWPQTWNNWTFYERLESSPLDSPEPVECGTGPYKLEYWKGGEWSIAKFDGYWAGWPANGSRGYLNRIVKKIVVEWGERKMGLLNGSYDIISVPIDRISEIWKQPGINCFYPIQRLMCSNIFFTFNISKESPYMGVPGGLSYGVLNESGIPPDFFSDIDVRKGFACSFNYTKFIEDALFNEATRPATCIVQGLPYYNPDQEKYNFDPTKAKEFFRRAWNGSLWEKGFTLTITYPKEGLLWTKTACEMLKATVEDLNPKFHIKLEEVNFSTYLHALTHSESPIFVVGWLADYPDSHDFVLPYMHSKVAYPHFQRYSNSYVDGLIERGISEQNETRRRAVYYELQSIYHDECISVPIAQPLTRFWSRSWVKGWYYNPMWSSYNLLYFYYIWKENLPPEDLNMDGVVNIIDISMAAKAFASYYKPADWHPKWNSRADLNQDQKVNIVDLSTIARKFNYESPPWQPP